MNVEASKTDEDLKFAWKHYELYLSIGQLVVKALHLFINRDYQAALQALLDTKRAEASWKTQFVLDMDAYNAYSGINTISFNPVIETYGKKCLEVKKKKKKKENVLTF